MLWEGFWEVLGRFGRYKNKVKKSFFFNINSWDDLPSFGRGLGRQDAAMFAQIATVFFRVASLEAAWGWQLLLEPDLEAIWRRFRWVLNQFWLPSWTKLGPKWLTTFSLDPKFGMLRQPAETTCSLRRYFCLLVLLLTYFMKLLTIWVPLSGPAECAERLQ